MPSFRMQDSPDKSENDQEALRQLQQVVHSPHDVLHPRETFIADFGRHPPVVTYIPQGSSDSRPVDSALAQAVAEPLFFFVFLDVDLEDAFTQLANPIFGIAVLDDIADIKVRADPWAVEVVDVPGELKRAKEELVPDVFDRDLDAVLLGIGKQLTDALLVSVCRRRGSRPLCLRPRGPTEPSCLRMICNRRIPGG